MKRNTLRWFGHIKRMKNEKFVKNVFVIETEGLDRINRPIGRWEDRVWEYMHERGNGRGERLVQAKKKCLDREM